MTHDLFKDIVDTQLKLCKAVLESKKEEYATEDRLHNFKVAARIQDTTPELALQGMAMKHFVSIMDIVSGKKVDWAVLDEKITDSINYLLLLKGLISERDYITEETV